MINTLGMTVEEMAEVRETFDADLLALSRHKLDTPHVVKVHAAQKLEGTRDRDPVVCCRYYRGSIFST